MTKTSKFHEGQKVRINNPNWTSGGIGFDHGDTVTILEIEAGDIWPIRAVAADGTTTGRLKAGEIKAIAKEPTAPMAKAVLDLLRRKGAITSLEAQGVLRCRQLPARVLDLKRLGHRIVTEMKI